MTIAGLCEATLQLAKYLHVRGSGTINLCEVQETYISSQLLCLAPWGLWRRLYCLALLVHHPGLKYSKDDDSLLPLDTDILIVLAERLAIYLALMMIYALPQSIIVLTLLLSAVHAYALPSGEIIKRNIETLGYAGSGCPANTVNIALQNNFQAVKIEFDAYVASIGPGVPKPEHRKNCQLHLDWGVKATQMSDYWWDGDTATLESTWVGPMPWQSYVFEDFTKEIWSPSKGNGILKVHTQIRLDNSQIQMGGGI
ncbi:hypothetical protein BDZ91DRAFT_764180 [Kalaharituber pfeilii]|nr:hypothetical protein BDZ91DRAFT_764180 [Kalaharituber pfeilii]